MYQQALKPITRDKYLLDSEVAELERICWADPCRDSIMILLDLATGARANELLRIKSTSFVDGTVKIPASKGGDEREIPLPPKLYALCLKLPTSSDGRLFPIGYDRLHDVWQLYRPVKKNFHSLRHTFAIKLYGKSKDLRLVQRALGHKSINTTLRYADVVDVQEKLQKHLVGA